MAETTLNSAHYVQQWSAKTFMEFQRESGFLPYMGEGANNIIVSRKELVSGGQIINVPFFPDLTGDGTADNGVLEGNEEAAQAHNEQVQVRFLRHATKFTKQDTSFVNFDLLSASKTLVKNWGKNKVRQRIIDQLLSVRVSGTGDNLYYGKVTSSSTGPVITAANSVGAVVSIDGRSVTTASEANKDTWITNNADRVVAGSVVGNVTTDHSATLGNCDTTNDLPSATVLNLARSKAKLSNPHITPFMVDGDMNEWYVLFVGTRAFRYFEADTTILAADREARARDVGALKNNPIFTGGELLYRGVIIKEIPEIPVLSGVGNGSADVAVAFLCGRQALAWGLGQEMKSVEDTSDYEFRRGLGIEMLDAYKKIHFDSSAPKQHGVVTCYMAVA
jgi:hypothetical protein